MALDNIVISLLIFAGAILMGFSVTATQQLLRLLRGSRYLRMWRTLVILMVFFLVGYLLALGVTILGHTQILAALTGVIFFFGALFVYFVVGLGQRTISDLASTMVSKTHLENIISTIPDVVVVANGKERIERVNQAATRIAGYMEEYLVGKQLSVLLPGLDLSKEACLDKIQNIESQMVTRDGQNLPVSLSISTRVGPDSRVADYVILVRDITEQKLTQARLMHDASHDPLTGLTNRNLLIELIEHAVELSRRDQHKEFGLLFIDLDHFKEVNDRLGHVLGDELLVQVGTRLGRCCRHEDMVSRYGGDEFMILLQNVISPEDVEGMAVRALRELEMPFEISSGRVKISASIGYLSTRNGTYSSAAEVIRDADQALYAAKLAGRSCYRRFGAGI